MKFTKLEDAQKAFNELEASHASVVKENEELVELSADLKQKLADKTAEAKSAGKPVEVTFEKQKYTVAIPSFRHNGVIYKAADLAKNPELVKELIDMESAVLVAE